MRSNSDKLTLAIRVCTESGGVYLGLREHLKVARTEVRQQWPLIAVDFARDGRAIGIECVGAEPLRLDQLLEIAGVRIPSSALRRATIRPDARRREAVSA